MPKILVPLSLGGPSKLPESQAENCTSNSCSASLSGVGRGLGLGFGV